ncbi:core histone macro-H2A.1-like [Centruroides vittatus]|uniref:core histone macro-H2A.1-like n=1 Tax=Centruroides vittatus TaxID=120091 RepID=UPI003510921B
MCSAKGKKKTTRSKSSKAGLVFPVARINRYLKKGTHHFRIGGITPVYLAAVLEYITAEILELAGNAARDNMKKRLNPRHILLAIANDAEIREMLKDVTIPSAGFVPDYAFLIKSSVVLKQKLARKDSTLDLTPKTKTQPKKDKIPVKKKKGVPVKKQSVPMKNPVVVLQSNILPQGNVRKCQLGNMPKVTVLTEKQLFLGQKLTVIQGDITDVTTDAIVNPTNNKFYMGGQVGKRLMEVGGKKFEEEIDKLRSKTTLQQTGVEICPGHNFMAGQVIHCFGPSRYDSSAVDVLKKTIKNCLALADKNNLRSLALPSIGSGTAGFPKREAAQIIMQTIADYFVVVMSSSIKQIYFVLYDKGSIDAYTNEISKIQPSTHLPSKNVTSS